MAVVPDCLDVDVLARAADATAGDGGQLLLDDAKPPALLLSMKATCQKPAIVGSACWRLGVVRVCVV